MTDYQQELDARNFNCPLPMMKTKKTLKTMSSGEVLHVIATDPTSVIDINILMESTGDKLLEQTNGDGEFHFFIKKA